MFFFGSRSAQTPNESIQQAGSYTDRNGVHQTAQGTMDRTASILLTLRWNHTYQVVHKWRKVAPGALAHHSHIFVYDQHGAHVVQFGVFRNRAGQTVFGWDGGNHGPIADDGGVPYHVSSSYRPNPLQATGQDIAAAFVKTQDECGPEYSTLHNNCQKFARLFMTKLGARHHRSLFHP